MARLVKHEERRDRPPMLRQEELVECQKYRQVVGEPVRATANLRQVVVTFLSMHLDRQIVDF